MKKLTRDPSKRKILTDFSVKQHEWIWKNRRWMKREVMCSSFYFHLSIFTVSLCLKMIYFSCSLKARNQGHNNKKERHIHIYQVEMLSAEVYFKLSLTWNLHCLSLLLERQL